MKKILVILSIVMTSLVLLGEESRDGKYVRKSISMIPQAIIFDTQVEKNEIVNINKSLFENDFFQEMAKVYIEVDRFDYNYLPKSAIDSLKRDLRGISDKEGLEEIIKNNLAKSILSVLNDSEVQKYRASNLKDESSYQRFAETKGKSMGITFEELKVLMNSAYIYIPYVSYMREKQDGNNLSYVIKGGVIWYSLKVNPDGSYYIEKERELETSGRGSVELGQIDPITKKLSAETYVYGEKTYNIRERQYPRYEALVAFTRNLGVKTKEINDFRLQAMIVDKENARYRANLGKKEGLYLDDGFEIMEIVENEAGNKEEKIVGFMRVSKTGDNKNSNEMTEFRQYLGSEVSEGLILVEKPLLGINLSVRPIVSKGMDIKADGVFLKDDASSALGLELGLSYNLAPIIGTSQVFYDIDFNYGVLSDGEMNDGVDGYNFGFYMGGTKKFWKKRQNISVGAGIGGEGVSFENSNKNTLTYTAYALKLKADYEYLVNPSFTLNGGAGFKLAFGTKAKYNDVEVDFEEDSSLSSMFFTFGGRYELNELPWNLFAWLDSMKKY